MVKKILQPKVLKVTTTLLLIAVLLNVGFLIADAAVSTQWGTAADGVIVSDPFSYGDQNNTQVIKTSDGNYIAYWFEESFVKLKAQKYTSSGNAAWQTGGITVYDGDTTAPFPTYLSRTYTSVIGVPTTDGGIIFVWSDRRLTGGWNQSIHGVRLTSAGAVHASWTANGSLLLDSGATGGDTVYDAIPDGADGVIIAYTQMPSQFAPYNGNPYVQHIDNTGATFTGWTANSGIQISSNPLPLNTSTYLVSTYHIVSNGTYDQYFVAYGDTITDVGADPNYHAKVAKVTENSPAAPTLTAPVSVLPSGSTNYTENQIMWDGTAGASAGVYYVGANYLQHLNSALTLTYGVSGVQFDTNSLHARLVADTSLTPYKPIIGWTYTGANTSIKSQRFTSAAGAADATWNSGNAVTVSNSSADALRPAMISDGSNGAYFIWEDTRDTDSNIYSQLVDSTGTVKFGSGTVDVQLTNLSDEDDLQAESIPWSGGSSDTDDIVGKSQIQITGSGFFMAWDSQKTGDDDNYIQIIDATLETLTFDPDGWPIQGPLDESDQEIVRTSDGNYMIAWADERNYSDVDIYIQKIDSTGTVQWTTNGLTISATSGNQPSLTSNIALVADNAGGAIIAWEDDRGGTTDVYTQKIDTDGVVQWTTNGVLINADGTEPALLSDGSGGAYISWTDSTAGNMDMYMTYIESAGTINASWSPPVVIANSAADEYDSQLILADSSNIIISYITDVTGKTQIEVDKISTSAVSAWSKSIIDGVESLANHSIISDGSGGAITAYEYQNATNYDILAHRVDSTGAFSWGSPTIICNATSNQTEPRLVSDNVASNNGAIITWQDERNLVADVYVQRINSSGTVQWTANGVAISDTGDSVGQLFPRITSNGGNGAIITFNSIVIPLYSDIFAQHINGSGTIQWTANGEYVETDQTLNNYDMYPEITSDGEGGAVIAWIRDISSTGGSDNVHAQLIGDTTVLNSGMCADADSTYELCGVQEISSYVLTFTDIPDSFEFSQITAGSTQHVCQNTSALGSPADTCSDSSTPDPPGLDDRLMVFDDRGSGGLEVQVQADGTFTNGSVTIPLTNLYLVTTIDETDPNKEAGINYTAFTGTKGIASEIDVKQTTPELDDISDPATYTALSTYSQFGGSPLVLMDGSLSSSLGREGYMSFFANFYLKIDSTQASGDYSLILTYDLLDNTT